MVLCQQVFFEKNKTQRSIKKAGTSRVEVLNGCGRYEAKLTAERDMGLRLKGENGIMKKRFSALQKDIDEAREECKALFDQKKELYQA